MRLSIPTIPRYALVNAADNATHPIVPVTKSYTINRVSEFLTQGGTASKGWNTTQDAVPSLLGEKGGTLVLTGAGVSVDSGIRAYRGRNGRYMNPNYKLSSILHFIFLFSLL